MEEIKTRKCCKCLEIKLLTKDYFTVDKCDKTGFTYSCKICRRIKQKEWKLNNPEKIKALNDKNAAKRKLFYDSPEGKISSRRAHLKRMYNITLEEYTLKLKEQNNKCKICCSENSFDRYGVLAVDHCHTTGNIRGLLCYKCNVGLGNFNDNQELLKKAINYLEQYKK